MHLEADMLLDTNTNCFVFGDGASETNLFFTDLLEKKLFL